MNGICLLTGAQLQVAAAVLGAAIVPNVVLSFSFSTEATADTMNIAAALAQPGLDRRRRDRLHSAGAERSAAADCGRLCRTGTRFRTTWIRRRRSRGHWDAAPGGPPGGVPSTNLTRFNPVPVAKATLGIPLFVTVPNGASGHAKPGPAGPS